MDQYDEDAILAADTADLILETAQKEAYEKFWAYRRYMNPGMFIDWWPREVAQALHHFWLEYKAGRRPKLLLQSPPQHGKSISIIDFMSWAAGQDRNTKIIFSSFSDRLGTRANLRMQRLCGSDKYVKTFGGPLLKGGGMLQNSRIIEFVGGDGYFRNTTVGGPITGEALDLGVIDDPIKGRAEAQSQLTRDKTWNWLTDDFLPRFSDKGALLMIMTRWHLDDPAGRLVERYPGVRVLRYSALAEQDEMHYAVDARGQPIVGPFVRKAGEPLFPQLKSGEFLKAQRDVMTLAGWQSVYQQSPIVAGGGMFPIEKAQLVPEAPAANELLGAIRYWDKAGTADGGAFSAGVLMLRMRDGMFYVVDVRRGRWSALDRERMIRQTAEIDRKLYERTRVVVEQEPGSGGKESAESTVRMLSGFSAEADKVTGSKELRADPFAAQWQAGNIRLVSAQWNREYLDECEHFPAGKYKDQVDASSGAFNKLASKYKYVSDMSWVS